MQGNMHSLYWEAPEHTHIEKSHDWFWAVGILALAGSVTSIILDNVLFGMVILLGTITVFILGNKKPRIIPFEISKRGIRVENDLYPFPTLESFSIDEESPSGPQLLLKSKKMLMMLIIIPLPEEYIDDVERMLASRLPEEHLTEPLGHMVLEYLGF